MYGGDCGEEASAHGGLARKSRAGERRVRGLAGGAASNRMIGMTEPKAKVTMTIDQALLDRVKALVGAGSTASVSAYVERAIGAQLAAEAALDADLADALLATGGPATRAERAHARKLLRGAA